MLIFYIMNCHMLDYSIACHVIYYDRSEYAIL